ncbi:hypothetical protein [Exiguobacterium aurantiacum]|uniref:hypothetical protein n=1 Tax=Exiguobacterium aurantiacum TaxID=33987 RepID=UPI00087798FB|nr:hypothetical protein [Exiguobacterium aurantiacum]
MQRSTTGKVARFMKGAIIGALALTLMAAGVAGFLIFTLTGNAWLDQIVQFGTDVSFQAEGLESSFERFSDSIELRVEQAIPEAVRPFFD